jgi:hypothetical protein
VHLDTPYLSAIAWYVKFSPGSSDLIAASALSIGAMVVEISRVEKYDALGVLKFVGRHANPGATRTGTLKHQVLHYLDKRSSALTTAA